MDSSKGWSSVMKSNGVLQTLQRRSIRASIQSEMGMEEVHCWGQRVTLRRLEVAKTKSSRA